MIIKYWFVVKDKFNPIVGFLYLFLKSHKLIVSVYILLFTIENKKIIIFVSTFTRKNKIFGYYSGFRQVIIGILHFIHQLAAKNEINRNSTYMVPPTQILEHNLNV